MSVVALGFCRDSYTDSYTDSYKDSYTDSYPDSQTELKKTLLLGFFAGIIRF